VIDSRFPRWSTRIPASSAWARSSASGIRRDFLTSFTSTFSQRGSARFDCGSKYSLFRSNWEASGYAADETSTTPAMPGWGQLEW
jgi:hypothetical protein